MSLRNIENYLSQFGKELTENSYEVIRGKRLKALKLAFKEGDHPETDFGNIIGNKFPLQKGVRGI